MAFSLSLVRQISVSTVRVTFTEQPNAVDASDTDDALNLDNYELNGSDDNFVVDVVTVDGDELSVDCRFAAALTAGTNNLAVTNIVSADAFVLTAPVSMSFTVRDRSDSDPLGHGAVNEEHANIIRQFLNPALKGRGWDSMIAALASGDQQNADNARLAFDQLFLSTASGPYLDRRASDEGISRPHGVNMSDDLFRKLAISQKNGKLTQKSILDVLEVFYGRDATRAYSDTAVAETFALQDEDELIILFEERNTIRVRFLREHFSRIGMATSLEVAAAITRACREAGNAAFAISYPDSITGEPKVRIYSGTLGLTSSIRIVGGRGNTVLLFPDPLFMP